MPHNFAVIECEQRSEEWYSARAGVVTASVASDMLAQPRKGASESVTRRNLRIQIALEQLTGRPCEDNGFLSADMRRGMEMEAEAFAAYEAETGNLVQRVGFLKHAELPVGCSPDGIVGDFEGGLELKCPKQSTHWEYLQLGGKVPSEYQAQILHSLFVTDLPYWDFVSYHPAFPEQMKLYRVRVERNESALAEYAGKFAAFWKEVEQELAAMRNLALEVA